MIVHAQCAFALHMVVGWWEEQQSYTELSSSLRFLSPKEPRNKASHAFHLCEVSTQELVV